jgi:hypothetical protein
MSELSLRYYVSICKGNSELLDKFKTLLLNDFQSMDSNFFNAAENGNVPAMLKELHKMHPIVSNLNFSKMVDLIEKYRHSAPDEFAGLHAELKICLKEIYSLLK